MDIPEHVYTRQPDAVAAIGRRRCPPLPGAPGALHAPPRRIGKALTRREHRPVGQTFLPAGDVAPAKRFVTAAPGARRLWNTSAAAGCGDCRPSKTSAFRPVGRVDKGQGWQSCSARRLPPLSWGRGRVNLVNPPNGLGAAHTLSPDARYGHPCPPLSRRCLRSRPPGFAGHLRRLEGMGSPSPSSTLD